MCDFGRHKAFPMPYGYVVDMGHELCLPSAGLLVGPCHSPHMQSRLGMSGRLRSRSRSSGFCQTRT